MYNNYFYLRRGVGELQTRLENFRLTDLYTQEKNRLILSFYSDSGNSVNLLYSTESSQPYFLLKEKYFKSKRNFVSFFKEYLPADFKKILIANDDRIIKLETSKFDIYFYFKGPGTNVLFFESQQNREFFKKINELKSSNQITELLSKIYSNELLIPAPIKTSLLKANKQQLDLPPSISEFIKKEMSLRSINSLSVNFLDELTPLIKEIYSDGISVFRKSVYDPPSFLPENYISAQITDCVDHKIFSSCGEAIDYFFYLKYISLNFTRNLFTTDTYLRKEIARLKKKIQNLEKKLESGSQEETYRKMGDLLIMNVKSLKKGMELIEVEDYISGTKIIVELRQDLSPKENINYYFEKARDTVKSYEHAKSLYSQSKSRLDKLVKLEIELDKAQVIEDILIIRKRLGMKDKEKSNKREVQGNYRHFVIDGKYHVFVGKDSRSNDLLTTRFAKQNDYWFHARGVPGSHVILRNNNPKEVMPKNILKKVASLTAFYSKSKTSGTSPVAYTFRKFVHKKKGLDPGQVFLSRENVLLVSPGIPPDCEPFQEETDLDPDE